MPDRLLRPPGDKHYELLCNWFENGVRSGIFTDGNFLNKTILIKILDQRSWPICQILRLHGDWCFDTNQPHFSFPVFFKYIQKTSHTKIWMFFIEDSWEDQVCRNYYSKRILQMKQFANHKDRIIFVESKVDLQSQFFRRDGYPDSSKLFNSIKRQYPYVVDAFAYPPPIKWFKPYKSEFVFFSAGHFTFDSKGRNVYIPSENIYPERLWAKILKNI